MLSRWFEEASEAQSSRGTRPQARPRGETSASEEARFYSHSTMMTVNIYSPISGTAVRPEGVPSPAAAPAGGSSQESNIPERPTATTTPEAPAGPAAAAAVPQSTSSSSSGSSSTVAAPPPSSSSSVESAALSATPPASSPDSGQRSQVDVTATPTSTPTSEPALSGKSRRRAPPTAAARIHI